MTPFFGMLGLGDVLLILLCLFLTGYVIYLHRQRDASVIADICQKSCEQAVADAEQHANEERLLERLLQLTVRDLPVRTYLQNALDLILMDMPLFRVQQKGVVFLADNKNSTLDLVYAKGVSAQLRGLCNHVPFGHCICGRVAEQKKEILCRHMDHRHDNQPEPVAGDHGHFSLPLLDGSELLGVLTLYFEASAQITPQEHQFLMRIAKILSIGIERRLAHNALIEAKIEAEKAADVRTRFLATMSHEIRTPLSGVIGMTGLLMDTRLDQEQKNIVSTIHESGEILMEIINDVLDFSKLDANRMEFECAPFNLQDLCDSVCRMLEYKANEAGVDLQRTYNLAAATTFTGDSARLSQILLNLIGNAIKFSPNGVVSLNVTYDHDHHIARFDVEDNGIGIPKEKQDRLFDSFTQVDASTSRKYGGTGLGLAICKKLINALDGKIGVESEEHKGSLFWFEIPLLQATPLKKAPLSQAGDLIVQPGLKVLVVEDNIINQKVARGYLVKFGCHVDLAHNGYEGVNLSRKENYDIILMDIQMPEVDGLEATRQIRTFAPRVPILALSANTSPEDKAACLDAGMDGFLGKPLSIEKIRETLARFSVSA